ncbi:MAG TPA: amino acid racemase, partial [Candidatus Paceibacterota bacterium]
TIGIIGGMGPLATVEFQRLLVEATPATCDQDHLDVLVHNNSQIPDRTASLASDDGASYVAAIIESGQRLVMAGATVLVIPCVTAHARFEQIQQGVTVPIVHIIESAAEEAAFSYRSVGILATNGTAREGFVGKVFGKHGLTTVLPDQLDQQKVMKAAYDVKAGNPRKSAELLEVARCLKARGAQALLLGCTELALYENVLRTVLPTINPMKATAKALVALSK